MTNLASNIAAAWTSKLEAARDDLMLTNTAPALFKPEWSERAIRDASAANRHAAYFTTVGAR